MRSELNDSLNFETTSIIAQPNRVMFGYFGQKCSNGFNRDAKKEINLAKSDVYTGQDGATYPR